MKYVGVDYHKRYSHVTVENERGEVIGRQKVESSKEAWAEFFAAASEEPIQAVVEATRNLDWIYDCLETFADEVVVAHPLRVKAIAAAKVKTDAIDSRVLADLLRAGLIPRAHVPTREVRRVRRVLRQRLFFVSVRTRIKNRIHTVVERYPEIERWPGMDADLFGKTGREWLERIELPKEDRRLLDQELKLLEACEAAIRGSDRWVAELGKANPVVERLRSIPGIGAFFSVLLWSEIDGIERFFSAKKLCAFAGLVPSTYSSGGKTVHGRITKQGNKWLRWAMVEAVQPAIRADLELRRFYDRLGHRKGANVAKVATAKRLLTIVYRVWKDQRVYRTRWADGVS